MKGKRDWEDYRGRKTDVRRGEVKWGRDRDGGIEVDKTKARQAKKKDMERKETKTRKGQWHRQTDGGEEWDTQKRDDSQSAHVCTSYSSSFHPTPLLLLPPSLHFVVCLMLFQHLGASASHPPSDAQIRLCCCSVITHQGRGKKKNPTQNKLKQRRLVWPNVPQTAPVQIPIYSHCNNSCVLAFSVSLFDSSRNESHLCSRSSNFLRINVSFPPTCSAVICFEPSKVKLWP